MQTKHLPNSEYRKECYRCFRAASVCICDRFADQVNNRTGVIVLQHHREVTHPIGTARIARLGLSKVEVRVARRHNGLKVDPKVPNKTALLYPSPRAIVLGSEPAGEVSENLIVLDGTWAQALSMYKANPWLADLPHVMIRPNKESNYRIRRQPKSGCLSTIEALVIGLKALEPNTQGIENLTKVFNEMVDLQLQYETHSRSKNSSLV